MKIGDKFKSLEQVQGIFAEYPIAKQLVIYRRGAGRFELTAILTDCPRIDWKKSALRSGIPYERNKKRGWERIQGYSIVNDATVHRFRRL